MTAPAGFAFVIECHDCQGTGDDPHGNACIFCDGYGLVDQYDDDTPEDDFDEDEFCTPTQGAPR